MKMSEERFLSEQHSVSHRSAIFEDDGLSAWLYLTEPNSEKPIADCWIYNCVSNPESPKTYMSRGVAPPAPSDFIRDDALTFDSETSSFCFMWSRDGESVALLKGNVLLGFIAFREQRSFSRNLKKAGLWGETLDENLYKNLFVGQE